MNFEVENNSSDLDNSNATINKNTTTTTTNTNTNSTLLNHNDTLLSDIIFPRPRYRLSNIVRSPPPKTTIAAVLLLIGGILMLSFGLHIFLDIDKKKDRGLSLIILGCISKFFFF